MIIQKKLNLRLFLFVFTFLFYPLTSFGKVIFSKTMIPPSQPYGTIKFNYSFKQNTNQNLQQEDGSTTYLGKDPKGQDYTYELSNERIYLWSPEGVQQIDIFKQNIIYVAINVPFTLVMNDTYFKIDSLHDHQKIEINFNEFTVNTPVTSFGLTRKEAYSNKKPSFYKAGTILRGLKGIQSEMSLILRAPALISLGNVTAEYELLIRPFYKDFYWFPKISGRLEVQWPFLSMGTNDEKWASILRLVHFNLIAGDKNWENNYSSFTNGFNTKNLNGLFWISDVLSMDDDALNSIRIGSISKPGIELFSPLSTGNIYKLPILGNTGLIQLGRYFAPPGSDNVIFYNNFNSGNKNKFYFGALNNTFILSDFKPSNERQEFHVSYFDFDSKCEGNFNTSRALRFPLQAVEFGDTLTIPPRPEFHLKVKTKNLGNKGINNIKLKRLKHCYDSDGFDTSKDTEEIEELLSINSENDHILKVDGSTYQLELNGSQYEISVKEPLTTVNIGLINYSEIPPSLISYSVYTSNNKIVGLNLNPMDSISVLPGTFIIKSIEKLIGAPASEYEQNIVIENK